jgi:hypothetical protein
MVLVSLNKEEISNKQNSLFFDGARENAQRHRQLLVTV